MKDYFINEAFDKALADYIDSLEHKEGVIYNSFLVLVIRKLVLIYGQLDIIGPYNAKDELLLHNNLLKFNISKMKLNKFFMNLQLFYNNDKLNITPNSVYIEIDKILVDMFMAKKINFNVTEEEIIDFKKHLYSPNSLNPLMISYNYLHSIDNFAIANYFDDQNKIYIKVQVVEPKVLLTPEAYRVVNKNYTDMCVLSAEDVKKINDEVYNSLNIDKNSVNFEYLYDLALYNYYNKNKKITTGNGYVDILLVMGMVSTVVMTIFILVFILLV